MEHSQTAREAVDYPPIALVLGDGPNHGHLSRAISQALAQEGYETQMLSDLGLNTPSPTDPDALDKLREVLRTCAQRWAGTGRGLYLHPGLNPWANRHELVVMGSELGFQVIGPSAKVTNQFGSKLNLFEYVNELGIPHLVQNFEPVQSVRELQKHLSTGDSERAYPVVLKSVHGFRGRSLVKVVYSASEIENDLPIWFEQVAKYEGEPIFILERYVEGAREIYLPFCRYRNGMIRNFPMVDVSLQSKREILISFCPAQGIDRRAQDEIAGATEKLLGSSQFVGVGGLFFLVDGPRAYLSDAVARLDDSFPVWEKCAETSAVFHQLEALNQDFPSKDLDVSPRSFFGQISIRAENPFLGTPQPGRLSEVDFDGQFGEFYSNYQAGQNIEWNQPKEIGVIEVEGTSRKDLVKKMQHDLDRLWLGGESQTNERFVGEILGHPWVKEGVFHSGFLDEEFLPQMTVDSKLVSAFAGVCRDLTKQTEGDWLVGTRRFKDEGESVNWVDGPIQLESGARVGRIAHEGEALPLRVSVAPLVEGLWQVRIGKWWAMVRKLAAQPGGGLKLYSQVSGNVHSVLFREGVPIEARQAIVVVDSLQQLVAHRLPLTAKIDKWLVGAEDSVVLGQALAEFSKV